MVVIGWASEMTAMSFGSTPGPLTESGCRTKLVTPVPGPAMGENDMDGIRFGTKQCAAVRIVRELISEPVQNEPPLNRLTTLGNWLPAS
jgi:hypothetical protein